MTCRPNIWGYVACSLALQRASFWWKLRSRMLLVFNSRYNIKCLLASLSQREQVWAPEVETMQTRLDVACGPVWNHQITISYHLHEILMSACWQRFQDWRWRREQPGNRSRSTGDWWCVCYKVGGVCVWGGVTTAFSETCLNPDTEETQDSFRSQQHLTNTVFRHIWCFCWSPILHFVKLVVTALLHCRGLYMMRLKF